jgi:hypothetical protein
MEASLMSSVQLGKLMPYYNNQERDALHVPVINARSWEPLKPGQHIVFVSDTSNPVLPVLVEAAKPGAPSDGIVDPFLTEPTNRNCSFWVLRSPGSLVKLIHMWSDEKIRPFYYVHEPEDDGCSGCYGDT